MSGDESPNDQHNQSQSRSGQQRGNPRRQGQPRGGQSQQPPVDQQGQQSQPQPAQQPQGRQQTHPPQSTSTDNYAEARERVQKYMLDDENISYALRYRPRGPISWLKAQLGYGVTYWFVTNQRLIEETRISGGHVFRDVPYGKMSTVEYGVKTPLSVLVIAGMFLLGGFGLLLAPVDLGQARVVGIGLLVLSLLAIAYAYFRKQQVLQVHSSGNATFLLNLRQKEEVDELLWYLHAERSKHQ